MHWVILCRKERIMNRYGAALCIFLGIFSGISAEASDMIPLEGGLSVPAAGSLQVWNADQSYIGMKAQEFLGHSDTAERAAHMAVARGWAAEGSQEEFTQIMKRILETGRFSQIRMMEKGTVYQAEAVRFSIRYDDLKKLNSMETANRPQWEKVLQGNADGSDLYDGKKKIFSIHQMIPWTEEKSNQGISYKRFLLRGYVFSHGMTFPVQLLVYRFAGPDEFYFLAVVSDETAGKHMTKLLDQSVSGAGRSLP